MVRRALTACVPPPYSAPMEATVNGERKELPDGLTVAGLLLHLGVRAERVAVERNGAVVKRARHAEEALAPGDVLEIVTFVGGG
jgi:sulfur carrier protein